MTSLHDIHTALKAGELMIDRPAAAIAALDLVAQVYDLPLAALHLDAPLFARAFPHDEVPAVVCPIFKGELTRYRMFRNAILDCQMLVDPGDVDGALWRSLRRVARLCLGADANTLYGVTSVLDPAYPPTALTRQEAMMVERALSGRKRARFRRGLAVFDRLHDHDLARRSKLLPSERIGRLPSLTGHALHEPLPPTLGALRDAAPRPTQNAIDFLWRLSVAGGLFSRSSDPSLPEVTRRLADIARLEPGRFGLSLSEVTRRQYLAKLAQCLGKAGYAVHPLPSPKLSLAPLPEKMVEPWLAAWIQLFAAGREIGVDSRDLERLSTLRMHAQSRRLAPQDITEDWIDDLVSRASEPVRRNIMKAASVLELVQHHALTETAPRTLKAKETQCAAS